MAKETSPQKVHIDNAERLLADARRDQAYHRENAALQQEIHAEMWERAVAIEPTTISGHQQLEYLRPQRDEARKAADAMHVLAGTTPAIYARQNIQTVRNLMNQFKAQYLLAKDAEANPEAYPEGTAGNALALAEGIRLCEEKIVELEAMVS